VLGILLIISFVIIAYLICQNRRLRSSKANKNKDRNNSEEIDENSDNNDANYEDMGNEEPTYTALKRPGPGEEENDGHLYAHLNEVHTDYVNQKETGF
jgi:FtsZ-interacting cell division protein ZipA